MSVWIWAIITVLLTIGVLVGSIIWVNKGHTIFGAFGRSDFKEDDQVIMYTLMVFLLCLFWPIVLLIAALMGLAIWIRNKIIKN